jgi:hypothetical protein
LALRVSSLSSISQPFSAPQVEEQQSPSVRLPSSQVSLPMTMPSPQMPSQVLGSPVAREADFS